MPQLLDIIGYWNTTGTNEFSEDDSWYGQIIFQNSGFFEGLVVEDSGVNFVAGKLDADQIRLCFVDSFGDTLPDIYKGKRLDNGYLGTLNETDENFEEIGIGASYIKLAQQAQIVQSDNLIEDLQKKIDDWKEIYLSGMNEFAYVDFLDTLEKENNDEVHSSHAEKSLLL